MDLEPIFSDLFGKTIANVFVFILSIVIENKFGVTKRLVKIYHKIKNSGVFVRIMVVYESSLPFEDLKEYIKDCFRNQYKNLTVNKDSSESLEFMVEDSFQISIQNQPNNEVSILTNKIKSTMQETTGDIQKILDVLNSCKENIKKEGNSPMNFEEKEFSLYLHLPYKDPFTKIYPPKDIKIKDYEIELIHDNSSIVKLKADILKIHTKYRHNLENIIKYFV